MITHLRKYFIHYLGQYFIFSIAYHIILYAMTIQPTKVVGPIQSQQSNEKFNSEKNPFWLIHISDTHINEFIPENLGKLDKVLNTSIMYQSDILLHTGDIVDNFGTSTRPKYGHQHENDMKEASKLFAKYRKNFKFMLGNPGNHDMFGVFSFDSPNFNYKKYYLFDNPISTYDEFQVSKCTVDDFTFISLNPFSFPTAHPLMMFHIVPKRRFLDRLESVISSCGANEKIIFHSHYPQAFYKEIFSSSSGHNAQELFANQNTISYLSGHLHLGHSSFEHQGGKTNSKYVESLSTSTTANMTFGILTIDNNRAVYHQIDANNPDKCLITSPVPKNQTSSSSYFIDESTMLRVMCFSDHKLQINIHGDIEGTLIFDRMIKNNIYLYKYDISSLFKNTNTNKLYRSLSFDGDWKGAISFYVKDPIPAFTETKYSWNNYNTIIHILLPIIWLYLIYVTIPIPIFKGREFIKFVTFGENNTFLNCFLTLSGLSLRFNVQNLILPYKVILFIVVLWPLCFPLCVMETEKHYGFIWTYGYVIDWSAHFSEHGQDYAIYYLVYLVLPLIFVGSSCGAGIPFLIVGLVETILLYGNSIYVTATWFWIEKLSETVSVELMHISIFTFVIIALYPLSLFAYSGLLFKARLREKSTDKKVYILMEEEDQL